MKDKPRIKLTLDEQEELHMKERLRQRAHEIMSNNPTPHLDVPGLNDHLIVCPNCYGFGSVPRRTMNVCQRCEGEGTINREDQ